MKPKVFGGLLAAILVAWAAAFYFLGWSKMSAFGEVEAKLDTQVSKLKNFAKKEADFPRQDLREKREAEQKRLDESYRAALGVMEERDQRYQAWLTGGDARPPLVAWQAAYKDAFNKLEADYRTHAALEAEAAMPFKELASLDAEKDLERYERLWKGQSAIARAIMTLPSARIDELYPDDKPPKADMGDALAQGPDLERLRWNVALRVEPKDLGALVQRLLDDSTVTFELFQLTEAKKREHLQANLLQPVPPGGAPLTEPPVRVKLLLNALDWKHQEAVPESK